MKPSRPRLWAGLGFTLLFALQGLYLIGFSLKEGAGLFTLMALSVVAGPIALLWLIYAGLQRSALGAWKYLATGALIALAFELLLPVSPISTTLLSTFEQRAVDAAQAGNVTSAPLLSNRGHPIGIRLAFDLRFPRDGAYAVSATLWPEEARYQSHLLGMSHLGGIAITPEAPPDGEGRHRFRAGTRYRMEVDFLPGFLYVAEHDQGTRRAGDLCLHLRGTPQLDLAGLEASLRDGPATRYRYEVSIGTASYFVRTRVAAAGQTAAFRPGDIHASALREGAGDCGF